MKNSVFVLALVCNLGSAWAANSQQAIDAAKKHRAEKSSSNASQPRTRTTSTAKPTAATSTGSIAQRVEACKQNASWNLYKRERCVWQVCKGRWDKEGCPPQGAKTSPGAQ